MNKLVCREGDEYIAAAPGDVFGSGGDRSQGGIVEQNIEGSDTAFAGFGKTVLDLEFSTLDQRGGRERDGDRLAAVLAIEQNAVFRSERRQCEVVVYGRPLGR